MKWRLQLDTPYWWPTESPYDLSVHCSEFVHADKAEIDTQNDLTRMLSLAPTWAQNLAQATVEPLASFRSAGSSWWREATTPEPIQRHVVSVVPSGGNPLSRAITYGYNLPVISQDDAKRDNLVWALQLNDNLREDEGIAFCASPIDSPWGRRLNWYLIQMGQYAVHLGQTGSATVYRYDTAHPSNAPTVLDRFQLIDVEHLVGDLFISITPVPGIGLAVKSHPLTSRASIGKTRNGIQNITGRLIRCSQLAADGSYRPANPAGPLAIAVNPYIGHRIALIRTRYVSPRTYTEGPREIGIPIITQTPTVALSQIPSPNVTATAQIVAPDGSAYQTGMRRYCVRITLSTTDAWRTPRVTGYSVHKDGVSTYANTTPVYVSGDPASTPDRLTHLEWSVTSHDRYEGRARVYVTSAACRAIVERGSTAYTLQKSADGGGTWSGVFGGIAEVSAIRPLAGTGQWAYDAELVLHDMWRRFEEVRYLWRPRHDAQSVADAINGVLAAAGFGPMVNTPQDALTTMLPPILSPDIPWEFAPREGDSGADILRVLLQLLRKQFIDYYLLYSWSGRTWRLYRRYRTEPTPWTLVPSGTRNSSARVWTYADLTIIPHPPEGNNLTVIGRHADNPMGTAAVVCLRNPASQTDQSSRDYQGRATHVVVTVSPLADETEVAKMARRLYDVTCRRRVEARVTLTHYAPMLTEGFPVKIQDAQGNYIAVDAPPGMPSEANVFWLKRSTIIVERDDLERQILELDSIWEALEE